MVTAPGSGAEIIPFLKTWVNLPMAIGFTVLYAKVRGCVTAHGPRFWTRSGQDTQAIGCPVSARRQSMAVSRA